MNRQRHETDSEEISFDDRICDDLSEDVLKYLSFTDKIRLQCVSKRFAKTIFVKQTRLVVRRKYVSWSILDMYLKLFIVPIIAVYTCEEMVCQLIRVLMNWLIVSITIRERYGMMAMDYDCLDQMIYKESTCTGAMYNKLNLKEFHSFEFQLQVWKSKVTDLLVVAERRPKW